MEDLRLWFLESRVRSLWTGISDKSWADFIIEESGKNRKALKHFFDAEKSDRVSEKGPMVCSKLGLVWTWFCIYNEGVLTLTERDSRPNQGLLTLEITVHRIHIGKVVFVIEKTKRFELYIHWYQRKDRVYFSWFHDILCDFRCCTWHDPAVWWRFRSTTTSTLMPPVIRTTVHSLPGKDGVFMPADRSLSNRKFFFCDYFGLRVHIIINYFI